MTELPSMWRVELLHPKVVHFPIALLAFGTLLFIAALWAGKRERFSFLLPAARLTLLAGVLGSWAAVITGRMADPIVVRDLCDPLVLESHERLAYLMSAMFTAGLALDFAFSRRGQSIYGLKILPLTAAIYLAATGLLFYIGHLGGKLVYQQAAAVHQPAEDCREFE
jgi:uncharacterized membrane protein